MIIFSKNDKDIYQSKETYLIFLLSLLLGGCYFILSYSIVEKGDIYVYSWILGGANEEGNFPLKSLLGIYPYLFLLWKIFFPDDALKYDPEHIISPPSNDFLIIFMFLRLILLFFHSLIILSYTQRLFPSDSKFQNIGLLIGIFVPLAFLGLRSTFKREVVMIIIESIPLVLLSKQKLIKPLLLFVLIGIGVLISPLALITVLIGFSFHFLRRIYKKHEIINLIILLLFLIIFMSVLIFDSSFLSFLSSLLGASAQYNLNLELIYLRRNFLTEFLMILFAIITFILFVIEKNNNYNLPYSNTFELSLICFILLTSGFTLLELIPPLLNYFFDLEMSYRSAIFLIQDQFPTQVAFILFGTLLLYFFTKEGDLLAELFDDRLFHLLFSFSVPFYLVSRVFEFGSFAVFPNLGIDGPDFEHFGAPLLVLMILLILRVIFIQFLEKDIITKEFILLILFTAFSIPIVFKDPFVYKFEYVIGISFFILASVCFYFLKNYTPLVKLSFTLVVYSIQSLISPSSFVFSIQHVISFLIGLSRTKLFIYFLNANFIVMVIIFMIIIVSFLNLCLKNTSFSEPDRLLISFSLPNILVFSYSYFFKNLDEILFVDVFLSLIFIFAISGIIISFIEKRFSVSNFFN